MGLWRLHRFPLFRQSWAEASRHPIHQDLSASWCPVCRWPGFLAFLRRDLSASCPVQSSKWMSREHHRAVLGSALVPGASVDFRSAVFAMAASRGVNHFRKLFPADCSANRFHSADQNYSMTRTYCFQNRS